MAAAIIPIIVAAAPLLQPLISALVIHVESLFGAKTGATKFQQVFDSVTKVSGDLSTAGKLPGILDPSSIASMIETTVQNMKSTGVLTPDNATSMVKAQAGNALGLSIQGTALQVTGGTLQIGQVHQSQSTNDATAKNKD